MVSTRPSMGKPKANSCSWHRGARLGASDHQLAPWCSGWGHLTASGEGGLTSVHTFAPGVTQKSPPLVTKTRYQVSSFASAQQRGSRWCPTSRDPSQFTAHPLGTITWSPMVGLHCAHNQPRLVAGRRPQSIAPIQVTQREQSTVSSPQDISPQLF